MCTLVRSIGRGDGIPVNIIWAILPFFLFILYDVNGILWRIRIFRSFFLLGVVLIIINTSVQIVDNYTAGSVNLVYLAPAVLCCVILFYSLFFALPFQKTYLSEQNPSQLCRTGLYAMCRHPGVLWFAGFYLFLSLLFPGRELAVYSFVCSVCNIVYAAFQDIWSFPRTFSDYDAYKKEVPFLFPNRKSILKVLGAIKNR